VFLNEPADLDLLSVALAQRWTSAAR